MAAKTYFEFVDEFYKANGCYPDGSQCWQAAIESAEAQSPAPNNAMDTISQQYYELLYSVERKFPNESRHQTALRYIREAESNSHCGSVAKQHHG